MSFKLICEELDYTPGCKWGWVVFRCTYGDDEAWERCMEVLTAHIRFQADDAELSYLMESLDWAVQEDPVLDEAPTREVRRRFQSWINNNAEPNRVSPRLYQCVMINREVMDSLLSAPPVENIDPDSGAYAIVIDEQWRPWAEELAELDEENRSGKSADQGYEPIEGCTDYDVGWMKVDLWHLLPEFYERMENQQWLPKYSRPPEIALSV